MFEDPGKKLKGGAIILFIVDLIGDLALGIYLWNNVWDIHWAIFFVATAIVSYFICLVLYGFGELVDNSAKAAFNSHKIPATKVVPYTERVSSTETVPSGNRTSSTENSFSSEETPAMKTKMSEDGTIHFSSRPTISLTCPFCGKPQKADRNFCFYCGKQFVFDNET